MLIAATAMALCAARCASAETRVGQLRCNITGGFGLLVTSKSAVTCVFYRPDDIVEFYTGSSTRVGADIGPDNAHRVVYAVLAKAPDDPAPAMLQGRFVGPGFGLSIGEGLAAHALIGTEGTVTLLPLGNSRFTGLNVNIGLADLDLTYAGSERRTLHSRY